MTSNFTVIIFLNFVVVSQYLNFTTKCRTGYLDWDGECIFAHGANGPDRPSMNLIDITIMPAFVAKDFRPKTRQVRYVAQLGKIFCVILMNFHKNKIFSQFLLSYKRTNVP